MCYARKDRDLEKKASRITESRLMEEDARRRREEFDWRRLKEEEKEPLTEWVKEIVRVR